MSVDLQVSLLLAIPLAIVANLVTPPVKRRFERYSEARSKRREADERKFSERVKTLAAEQGEFHDLLLTTLLRAFYIFAMFTLITTAVGFFVYPFGAAVALVGAVWTLEVVRGPVQLARAVRRHKAAD